MKKFLPLILGLLLFGYMEAQTVVFHENFEQPSGADSLTAYSSNASNTWAISTDLHAGGLQSDSAKCSPHDTLTLTTNSFSTVGNAFVLLDFDHICKIEVLDKAIVEVSTDNGLTWAKLDSNHYMGNSTNFGSGGNVFNATSYGGTWKSSQTQYTPNNTWWKHETFNISSLTANAANVKVRFSLIDVNGITMFENYGWFLDNIEISASPSELMPPIVNLLPPVPQDTITTSSPQTVMAKISDNSGIDTAYIVYYVNGNLTDTLGMTNFAADSFSVDIPFVGFGRTVTWFIEAIDMATAANTTQTNNYSYFLKYLPLNVVQVGTGTSSQSYPFYTYYHDSRTQILLTATELQSLGASAGAIDQIGFDITSAASQMMNGFNIEMKHTSSSSIFSFVSGGFTNVYSGTYTVPGAGWQMINLQNSFNWDGTSNILINICFDNTSFTSSSTVNSTSASGMTVHNHLDNDAGCSLGSGTPESNRPNVRLRINVPSTLLNDAGVAHIVNPTGGVVANSNFDVKAKIKNFGVDTISSAEVKWQLDGNAKTTYNYTGSLLPDSLSSELTLGTLSVGQGPHNLKLWTDNPNNTFDDNTGNDTMSLAFYGCANLLSGTYTIGGTSPDYNSFADALLGLTQCGINGPVTFNVAAGTYDEQLYIPAISGASATNNITFQSLANDSSMVTLQFGAVGSSDNYVVKLDGTSYINFSGMTFKALDSSYANAVVMKGSPSSISFENNRFMGQNLMDDSDERALVFTADTLGSNITFTNNRFVNGSNALVLSGSSMTNVDVSNNIFNNQYASTVQINGSEAAVVKHNTVSTFSAYDSYNAFFINDASGAFEVSYNNITAENTAIGYGIFINESAGDSLNHALVYNNIALINGNANTNNLSAGLINLESRFVDYYYNTVKMTGNDQNTVAMAIYDNSAGYSRGVVVKNNIFANMASGYAVFTLNIDSANITNNYNNLYTDGNGDYISLNGAIINNLTEWQAATGKAANSVNIDPYFASSTDLHTTNNSLNATGTPIAGITDDIDGDTRNATTPDIGADEFDASPYDLTSLEVLAPIGQCGLSSSEDVTIRIKNIGSAAVNSFSVSYQIAGSASAITETVNTTLNPGDTLDYTFNAKANLDVFANAKDSVFAFSAWVDYSSDPIAQNDSIFFNVFSGYQPTDPITQPWSVAFGDSTTITAQSPDTLVWYANDSITAKMSSGKYFHTPVLYDTTTYYVAATASSPFDLITGTGNASQNYIPAYGYYDYSWSAIIIDASEMTGDAVLDTIGFYVDNSPSNYQMLDQRIYMANVSYSSFANTNKPDPSSFEYVFQGDLTYNGGGWKNIGLDTSFAYDGNSNLLVYVENHDGSYVSGYPQWRSTDHSGADNAIYAYADVSMPMGAGNYQISRPDVRFTGVNVGCESNRVPVTVNVSGIPTDNAGISSISTNSGCGLAMEPVTINIFNNASVAVNGGLTAAYQIDNNPFITPEAVGLTIQPYDTVSYTFNTLADLSAAMADTTYSITAYVMLQGDTFNSNDTIILSNLQSLYTPAAISVNDTTVDYGKKVTKTVNSNSIVFWYANDTIQNPIFKGSTYTTPVLYDTTIYYLENVVYGSLNQNIGTGAQSQYNAPANGYYNYNWANMLYLSSEIGTDGPIDTLKFYVDNSVSGFTMPSQKVFISHQPAATLSTTKPDPATMTKVYEGPVTWDGPGWVAIPLSTSFDYNGQDNLQIYWENRDGSFAFSGYPNFAATSTGTTLCVENHLDASFPTTAGAANDRPNIVLAGESKGCSSARVPWTVNVLGQPDYDAAIIDIPDPNTGTELTAAEPVTVSLWNSGGLAISNFDVNYRIDSGSVVTETVSTSISSGDTLDYTFNQMADLQSYKTYDITAWSSLSGDTTNANDTVYKQVTNNPLVYCISEADYDADSEIDEVIFNSISNNTAGICATYSDFTSMSTTLLAGGTYNMSVTLGTCGGDFTKNAVVYFDWNRDGDFDDAGETGPTFGPAPATQTFTNNIQVPVNAATGNIRMRVVAQETSTPSAILPCGTYSYGETEDYTLVVIQPIPNDAGVTAILSPQFYGNEGDQDTLEVTVRNFGTDTIFSVDVNYTVNGGTPVSHTVNDTILPQTNISVQLPSFIRPADTSTICAYTVLPGDSNLMNDQSCQDFYGLPLFDADVINVHALSGGCGLSMDTIRVDIKNSGADTLVSGFNVKYLINDVASTIVTETVNVDILPDSVYTHEFAVTVDLTVTTFDSLFRFSVWTEYTNDNNPKNDTNMTEVLSKHTPATPIVNDTNINYGTSADIIAQATAPVYWYDSLNSTVPIHIGDTLITPLMFDSAVYYYEAVNVADKSPIIISEYSSDPDFIEITNISNQPFDATGWQVLMNDNSSNINFAEPTTWQLGQFMGNEVKEGNEMVEFGSVGWINDDNIWIMLIDDQGNIMDFVASNWTAADIQGMSVTSGGFTALNPGSEWTGDGVTSTGDFIIRQTFDVNDATDWTSDTSGSAGTYNPGMVAAPGFSIGACMSARDSVNVNVVFPANNAGITDIMVNSGCKMTTTEPVTIEIINGGSNTITTGLTAKYKIDNGSFITPEQVNLTIPSKDTVLYTFTTTANLAAGANDTSFVITAVVDLIGDTYTMNDTIVSGTISSLYTPASPMLTNPTITFGTKANLSYTSTDSLFWYVNDSIMNEFHIGNAYTTPYLYDTTVYYVEQTIFSPFSSQIGAGTQTTNYIPAYGFFDYGWSNTLYLSSEVGSSAIIDTIAFYVDNSIASYVMPNQTMYLANSSLTTLGTSKPDPSTMTQVFDGSVDWSGPGWIYIPLDNSFFYDGQSTLQLYWENRDGSYSSGYPQFRGSSISSNLCVYEYEDGSFPITDGSQSSVRPNIKLSGSDKGCGSIRVPWTVNVIGHPPIDGQLAEVLAPKTGQLKTNSEPVIYRIKNNGTDSLLNVKVGYIFDGQQAVEENLNVNMGPGDTLVHAFASTVDMTQFKSYPMTSYVNVVNDTVTVNDTIFRTVTNKLDYCISKATSAYDDTHIDTVAVNNLFNVSNNSSADYSDFTSSVSPAVLYPTMTHNITISMDAGTFNDAVVKVFIDANRDGTLDEATETFVTESFTSSANQNITSTITLPPGSASGLALMRVVLQETTTPADVHPCGTYSYGETEDYLVQITPQIPQDAGIIMMPRPNKFMINANQQFEVMVKNYGTNTINALAIDYNMGSVSGTFNYGNAIAPGDTAVVSMPNLTMPYGNHMLCVNTVLANDSNVFNDGHCKPIYRQMTTNPPYVDNFETHNYFMRDTTTGKVTQWEFGKPMGSNINVAHSGQTAWMIDLDSTYKNSTTDILYSPKFATGNTGVDSLIFWHYMDAEAGEDGGYVQYMNVTGHWTTLGMANDPTAVNWYTDTVIGQPAFSGNSSGWTRSSICIDAAHVPNMASITQFRFVFASSASGNSGDGWAIDDFQIKIPRVQFDAGISAIINPAGSTVTGSNTTVEVRVKNYGYDPLTATDITYQVGNNIAVTESWTGNLLTDSSEVFTFSTPYTGPSSDYTLRAYTELYNDGNLNNDTSSNMIISQAAALDAGVIGIWPNDSIIRLHPTDVTIRIFNYGSQELTSIDVEYESTPHPAVTEVWTGNLPSGDSVDYTFSTPLVVNGFGVFTLCGTTMLTNDANTMNDEICIQGDISQGIESKVLEGFILHQNIPNPSDGLTSVEFEVPYGGKAEFNLVDLFGRTLYNEQLNVTTGSHTVKLDAATVPAGVYYYSVTFDGYRLVKKMIVSK